MKSNNYSTNWRRKIKKVLIQELGGCCVDCGYSKNPRYLEFDHKNPEEKKAKINLLLRTSALSEIFAEAKKCELRCVSCHDKRHGTDWKVR